MNPSIFIGLPHRGNIRFEHVPNIIEWSKSYPIALGSSTMYPIAGARNELVDFFLQTKCTHILFLDSDTIMPRDGLPRLDRESLEILYMWLIPGKDINNRSGLSISEKCTSKWENYKIDHINAINYLHTIELPDGKA